MKIVLILTAILYTSLASAQIMREYPSANRGKPTRGSNYNERTTIGDPYTNSNPNNSSPSRQLPARNRVCNFVCKNLSQNIHIDEKTELAATILRQYGEQAENLLRSMGASDKDIEFLSEINASELDLQ